MNFSNTSKKEKRKINKHPWVGNQVNSTFGQINVIPDSRIEGAFLSGDI